MYMNYIYPNTRERERERERECYEGVGQGSLYSKWVSSNVFCFVYVLFFLLSFLSVHPYMHVVYHEAPGLQPMDREKTEEE